MRHAVVVDYIMNPSYVIRFVLTNLIDATMFG